VHASRVARLHALGHSHAVHLHVHYARMAHLAVTGAGATVLGKIVRLGDCLIVSSHRACVP